MLYLTERFDPDVLDAPGMREAFVTWMHEAGRNGIEGYMTDWIAAALPWGLDIAAVTATVHVWFGEQDPLIPVEHASYLGNKLAHSDRNSCPQCRHFVPVGHWPDILDQLLNR